MKLVIVATLICQLAYASGFLHQVLGHPFYLSLNTFEDTQGTIQSHFFIFEQEIYATSWTSSYLPEWSWSKPYYYDVGSGRLFDSYAGIVRFSRITELFENVSWRPGSYVFLRVENVLNNKLFDGNNFQPLTNVTLGLVEQNKIFDTGGTHIYSIS